MFAVYPFLFHGINKQKIMIKQCVCVSVTGASLLMAWEYLFSRSSVSQ